MLKRLSARLGDARPLNVFVWNMAAFSTGQVLRIAGNLIMTRLLAPEMFGVVGLVMAVQFVLSLVTDMGLRSVVVQSKQGDEKHFLDTVWTLEVLRGVGIWLIALIGALSLAIAGGHGLLPAGSAWSAPVLPALLAVATLTAVISGFQSTGLMHATRNLDAKRIAAIELTSQVAGLVTMVIAGFLTRSIWSLVVGGLVAAAVTTLLSHILFADHRNRFCWDGSSLKEIVRTGRWILLSSLVFAFGANIDRFLFGGYITASEFGLYVLALNLLLLVDAIASRVFSSVALAWLSEAARSSPEAFRKRLFQLRVPIDMAMIAMAGFLYVLGPSIVEVLYDDRYLDAGRILQLLSFSLLFTRFGILNMAYVALGRAELMAAVHVVKLVAALLCLIIGVHFYGFTGGLLAVALHGLFPVLYMLWVNREAGLNKLSHELLIPPIAWPIGYLAGSAVLALFALIT